MLRRHGTLEQGVDFIQVSIGEVVHRHRAAHLDLAEAVNLTFRHVVR